MEQSLYGLHKGQCRANSRVRNGVWFDANWHMLGWGDLTDGELRRIAKEIPFGHLFIILKHALTVPSVEQCIGLIEQRRIYTISDDSETLVHMDGVRYHRVQRPTAAGVIERIRRLNIR